MALSPHGKKSYRFALIGRDKMPEPGEKGRDRYWGFVETVERSSRKLAEGRASIGTS